MPFLPKEAYPEEHKSRHTDGFSFFQNTSHYLPCYVVRRQPPNSETYHRVLTLIVPRVWEIGYTQPCIKCQGKTHTHFVYFWSWQTHPYTHLEATSYIPQQGQSLHSWTTYLFTTGCNKNKYTIKFFWVAFISRFATAILSGETELALGTIRVKRYWEWVLIYFEISTLMSEFYDVQSENHLNQQTVGGCTGQQNIYFFLMSYFPGNIF